MISLLGAEKLSLVEIEAFLTASDSVWFVDSSRLNSINGWNGCFAITNTRFRGGAAKGFCWLISSA